MFNVSNTGSKCLEVLSPDDIKRAYDFVTNTTIRCPGPDVHFNSKKVLGRSKFCKMLRDHPTNGTQILHNGVGKQRTVAWLETRLMGTNTCNKDILQMEQRSLQGSIVQNGKETWGNTSEFNYPYFPRIHRNFQGKYLRANVTRWRDFFYEDVASQSSHVSVENATESEVVHPVRLKVIFLLGQTPSNETQSQIVAESDQFGDIVQESFLDSYNNLTLKSVMLLKWVTNNCLDRVRFIMKCDDDVFVNVPNLLHILLGGIVPVYNDTLSFYDLTNLMATRKKTAIVEPKRLLMGFLFCRAKPIADVTSKWYSPIYMYSGTTYPNYLSGTG
uniref:Hexosyltransferase n=1 Tax=Phlebotomus papatasi TaxID=29031 RepID=A0A1B0DAS4_PHLPP